MSSGRTETRASARPVASRSADTIDRFGWFGVEQIAVSWQRLLGLALLTAGAVLTLKR